MITYHVHGRGVATAALAGQMQNWGVGFAYYDPALRVTIIKCSAEVAATLRTKPCIASVEEPKKPPMASSPHFGELAPVQETDGWRN
jgi:hypothetical protein